MTYTSTHRNYLYFNVFSFKFLLYLKNMNNYTHRYITKLQLLNDTQYKFEIAQSLNVKLYKSLLYSVDEIFEYSFPKRVK